MTLKLKPRSDTDYELLEEGTHLAICYAVWDIGVQWDDKWHKAIPKVVVMWELPDTRIEIDRDGKKIDLPRAISKKYTASLGSKAHLRRDLEAWRGRRFSDDESEMFDLQNILGAGCQLSIVHYEHDGKKYANVSTVIGLPRGMKIGTAENPLRYYDIEEKPVIEIPVDAPEWIQKLIENSEQYNLQISRGGRIPEPTGIEAPPEEEDDGLPF